MWWSYFDTKFSTCIKFSMFFNLALTFYLQANLLLFPTVPSYMGLQIPCVFRWSDGKKKAGKPAVQSGNILFYLQIPGYICCHPRVVRLHLPSGHGSGDGVRFRDGSEQRISQSLRKFPVFHTKGQLFWHRVYFYCRCGRCWCGRPLPDNLSECRSPEGLHILQPGSIFRIDRSVTAGSDFSQPQVFGQKTRMPETG